MKSEKEHFEAVQLPSVVSVIPDERDRMEILDLLDEGFALDQEIKLKVSRLEEIKAELLVVQNERQLPGLRNGEVAFKASWVDGKNTLSRELLLENGVPPGTIEKSFKKSEGFWQKRFLSLRRK